ncbi:hypothetical protein PCURB6_26720 [Paenibacillus curdlanolyticus]|nr:hypothetical protein PCURB6_26720 [Paenibacillus curdlanolyticus]
MKEEPLTCCECVSWNDGKCDRYAWIDGVSEYCQANESACDEFYPKEQ